MPITAIDTRRRLFHALERVFPVRFEPREAGDLTGLDAFVAFPSATSDDADLTRAELPCLIVHEVDGGVRRIQESLVELALTSGVDPRLAGRRFNDRSVVGQPALACSQADEILASTSDGPTWVRRSGKGPNFYGSSIPLGDLGPGESIRDYLRFDRFSSLLPLTHLLDEVTRELGWTPPPLRASFIIDDPNLHWPTYGYVRFKELARHAQAHGYHVAMASIPLDLWYFDRRAVRIFHENARHLSLVVHGNDHVRAELARPRSERESHLLLSQALRRVAAFERRSGLEIARVVVPPHGDCSDAMFEALAAMGFDAIAWSPKPRSEISGWEVGEFSAGGLPSLPRPLLTDWEDLPFRAYLNQPIVLEGHHTDLADGLDVLAQTVEEVSRLGSVIWQSPGDLASTNFAVRRLGEVLQVRLYSRRVRLVLPEGIESIEVETPTYAMQEQDSIVMRSIGTAPWRESSRMHEAVPVIPGELEIRLVRSGAPRIQELGSGLSLWPYVRRTLTEGRDRALPLANTLRRRRMR